MKRRDSPYQKTGKNGTAATLLKNRQNLSRGFLTALGSDRTQRVALIYTGADGFPGPAGYDRESAI
jgi:hypothetical protein